MQGYVVYYGTNAAQPELSTNVGTATLATIGNLAPGLTYYFEVAAYDTNDVVGPLSDELSCVVPGYSQFAPGGVTIAPGSLPESVTLTWNPVPDPAVQGYMVYYGTTNGMLMSSVDAGAATSMTISNLNPWLTCYFSVAAYDTNDLAGPASAGLAYAVPGTVMLTPGASSGDPVNINFQIAPLCWFEVQASADLSAWDTIWITSVYQFNGWAVVSDFESPDFPQRFYRILSHQGTPRFGITKRKSQSASETGSNGSTRILPRKLRERKWAKASLVRSSGKIESMTGLSFPAAAHFRVAWMSARLRP